MAFFNFVGGIQTHLLMCLASNSPQNIAKNNSRKRVLSQDTTKVLFALFASGKLKLKFCREIVTNQSKVNHLKSMLTLPSQTNFLLSAMNRIGVQATEKV